MRIKIKKLSVIILGILIFIVLSGCKTVPVKTEDGLYVMIYDYENHALKDVKITQNKKQLGVSDIYGRAIIFPDEKEIPVITFEKLGYEIVSIDLNKDHLLYVKMGSASYFAELSEKNFDDGKYEEAMMNIEKALSIDKRSDYEYLKNVIKGKYE